MPRTTIDGTTVFMTITNGVAKSELSWGSSFEGNQQSYSKLALGFGEFVGLKSGMSNRSFRDLAHYSHDKMKEADKKKEAPLAEYLPALCPGMTPEEMTTFCSSKKAKTGWLHMAII